MDEVFAPFTLAVLDPWPSQDPWGHQGLAQMRPVILRRWALTTTFPERGARDRRVPAMRHKSAVAKSSARPDFLPERLRRRQLHRLSERPCFLERILAGVAAAGQGAVGGEGKPGEAFADQVVGGGVGVELVRQRQFGIIGLTV